MPIMALDYGTRYVGVAITDPSDKIALRDRVIDQQQTDLFQAITNIITKEAITNVVVGLPRSLMGHDTAQTEKTKHFLSRLRQVIPSYVAVSTGDETYTSREARRILTAQGMAITQEHAEAARLILEQYLCRR